MKILHSSDIHGSYKVLLNGEHDFDIWIDTGDFLDNKGRVQLISGWNSACRISPNAEVVYQRKFISRKNLLQRFKDWLDGRPAIIMPGNHDFVNFGIELKQAGCPNVYLVTPDGVEVNGIKFAGFREINFMIGEWMGETNDFSQLIDRVWDANPDVLVTHSPPGGILSAPIGSPDDYGVAELTSALAYRPHSIKAHFFGHEHACGGMTDDQMGVKFINGARHALVHELEL